VYTSGDYQYILLEDGTAAIKGYTGSDTEIVIPSEVDGYTVTIIVGGSYVAGAFTDNTSIREVTIPGTVKMIALRAFEGCTSLETVIYESGSGTKNDKVIGRSAFRGCTALKTLELPETLYEIEKFAFAGCGMKAVYIPDGVRRIMYDAFAGCENLSVVSIPPGIILVGEDTGGMSFEGCSKLAVVYIRERNNDDVGKSIIYSYAFEGAERLKTLVIPKHILAYYGIVNKCPALETVVFQDGCKQATIFYTSYVADWKNKTSVTTCSIKDIYIPSSVEEIRMTDDTVTTGLTIHGDAGSYAEEFAAAHGIAFSTEPYTNVYQTVYNGNDYSDVYDKDYYLLYNPDVTYEYGDDDEAALAHFVEYGIAEGRCAKEDFNVVKYAYGLLNDDLRAEYGEDVVQYYSHYMNYGRYEGRSTSDWDEIFDYKSYLQAYPDVRKYIEETYTTDGNQEGWALWHYYEYGISEGRKANNEFSVLNYAASNPDVFKAYSVYNEDGSITTDFRAIAVHYLQYGKEEGRSITADINLNDLAQLRPDVVERLGINNLSGWVDWYISSYENGL
jgi:hypothetical protein